MTKTEYRKKQSELRRVTRHMCNVGLAVSVKWGHLMRLRAEVEKEIAPKLAAMRQAERYMITGVTSLLENSPELYGCKASVPDIYRMHTGGAKADCELSEMESALVHCASRNESPDMPLTKHNI